MKESLKVLQKAAEIQTQKSNFESLDDSCIDIINYASFFVSYSRGTMDGQDPARDFLNRLPKQNASTSI